MRGVVDGVGDHSSGFDKGIFVDELAGLDSGSKCAGWISAGQALRADSGDHPFGRASPRDCENQKIHQIPGLPRYECKHLALTNLDSFAESFIALLLPPSPFFRFSSDLVAIRYLLLEVGLDLLHPSIVLATFMVVAFERVLCIVEAFQSDESFGAPEERLERCRMVDRFVFLGDLLLARCQYRCAITDA